MYNGKQWEFRIHRDDVTLHSSWKGHGDWHTIRASHEEFTFRIAGNNLLVLDVTGRVVTEYPLSCSKPYPEFTLFSALMDGSVYVFEYRYKD